MNIAIIDADLIGRKKHSFPNLACMKISGYYKANGNNVELKLDYNNLDKYDKVFISKVFTDTQINENILKLDNVEYGGTGFFLDEAPSLPYEIEHHKPDYNLYNKWVSSQIDKGIKPSKFDNYLNCSIGFITRGCFRKCNFCVNKKYDKVFKASNINEFLDTSKKKIILCDDNFLAHPNWRELLTSLEKTKKSFQFRQGLDIRLMTEEKAKIFSKVKYNGDFIFAFDNIEDKDLIEEKLIIWRKYVTKTTKLYVFCGYDRNDKWDEDFWLQDIVNTFERIKVLMKYRCLPYIMRYNRYNESPYRGMYITLARWCNQPSMFKKKSFRDYCYNTKGIGNSARRYIDEFEKMHPNIAKKFYDIKYEDFIN